MKALLPILIATAILPFQANAACWREISATGEAVISIDDCSIVKDGAYKKAWFKWQYSSLQTTEDYPTKSYIKTMSLDYFNCSTRQSASVKGIYYSEDGAVVKSEAIEVKRVRFDEAPPETVAETLLNYVCKPQK